MSSRFIQTLVPLLMLISTGEACRLWAVISGPGANLSDDFELIVSQLDAYQTQSTQYYNNDGWALLYQNSPVLDSLTQLWRSPDPAIIDPDFDEMVQTILDPAHSASMAHGHIREGSSGSEGIPNPHPFIFQTEDQTFTFSHNGTVNKSILRDLLTDNGEDDSWLQDHPPNTHGCGDWTDNQAWLCVVDSELYFSWIMRCIVESGDVLSGISTALYALESPLSPSQTIGNKNFILTDGFGLYAYRSTPNSLGHRLYYSLATAGFPDPYTDLTQQHLSVMTELPDVPPSSMMNWIEMENYLMIHFEPASGLTLYPNPGAAALLGDLDQNGAIDILDLVWQVALVLGEIEGNEYQLWAADINDDGELDISDTIWLVNIIIFS